MFFLDWSSFDTVQKSVGQNGVLSGLPGMVGLPTFDHFLGGVERIFSPRKSEEESKESEGRTSTDQSSTDESKSQLFVPSFLRRKSTHAVPTQKSNRQELLDYFQRRQSSPSSHRPSFDVEKQVREAMGEDMAEKKKEQVNVVPDTAAPDLKQDLGVWNEERRGDAQEGVTTSEPQPTQMTMENSESTPAKPRLDDSQAPLKQSTEPKPNKPNPEPLEVDDMDPTEELQKLSKQSSGEDSEPSPTTTKLTPITSSQLVQSPTETAPPQDFNPTTTTTNDDEPSASRPEKLATGPPKDEEHATGDATGNPILTLLQHFRPSAGKAPISKKLSKVYHRSQTVSKTPSESSNDVRPPPPRTTFFESFPSLINPPLPDVEFITQPSSRAKTIFHDRLYTPDDIPPVSSQRTTDFGPSTSDEQSTKREKLRLEEKIARDWHSDMTWRKVLVKLEPDAHNNIIVRRMFANAYGWPVIEHLVREHFMHDPEGLEREFEQEVGVIAIGFEEGVLGEREDEGTRSPSWESPMMDLESEDDMGESGISERPESMGRALMSDEENGEVVEMTEFSSSKEFTSSSNADGNEESNVVNGKGQV